MPGALQSNLRGSPVPPQRSGEIGAATWLFAVVADVQWLRKRGQRHGDGKGQVSGGTEVVCLLGPQPVSVLGPAPCDRAGRRGPRSTGPRG